jgi:hypothetical protein
MLLLESLDQQEAHPGYQAQEAQPMMQYPAELLSILLQLVINQ